MRHHTSIYIYLYPNLFNIHAANTILSRYAPPVNRAFQSGFEIEPVMCQTVNTVFDKNYCPWVSCGEWCLTKTSGYCPQIHATTRRNGTDIQLEGCTMYTSVSCPEVCTYFHPSLFSFISNNIQMFESNFDKIS